MNDICWDRKVNSNARKYYNFTSFIFEIKNCVINVA